MKDIRIWSTKQGKVLQILAGAHHSTVTCARFTPDEQYLISTSRDNSVKVWDLRTWKQIGSSFEETRYTCPASAGVKNKSDFCVSPNGQFVVVGSQNGAVLVLDISTGEIKVEEIYQGEHSSPVVGCAWMPTNKQQSAFATIDTTGGLYIWQE